MPATVAPHMPTADQVAACRWLPEEELRVYSAEYERTGFQRLTAPRGNTGHGGCNRFFAKSL